MNIMWIDNLTNKIITVNVENDKIVYNGKHYNLDDVKINRVEKTYYKIIRKEKLKRIYENTKKSK